jgi:hypothetical protein
VDVDMDTWTEPIKELTKHLVKKTETGLVGFIF